MDEMEAIVPTENTFKTMQSASCKKMLVLSHEEMRVILPSLIRICSCKGLSDSEKFSVYKGEICKKIQTYEETNFIAKLQTIDFKMIQDDALKEQHLRNKMHDGKHGKNKVVGNLSSKGLALEFEESNPTKRTRIVLSEILRLKSEAAENHGFALDDSELFQCSTFHQEISDVLCVIFAELPFLLPIAEVSEALLRVKYGPLVLCNLIVNNPDYFEIVCSSILSHACSNEEMDHESQVRMKTLKMLCRMNPSYKRDLRAEGVALCKLAALVIELSVQTTSKGSRSDIVPFFTGLLLASDVKTKEWIADYIKTAQKEHKENALYLFKGQLIKEMTGVIVQTGLHEDAMETGDAIDQSDDVNSHMMHGIAIMRLFCALKTTSGFKFTHDEVDILIDLITCRTPNTEIGSRFVTVALCTLVGSAFLLSTTEREEKVTTWLKSLIQQPSLTKEGDSFVSYGEILLLVAIHFHANTLEPIVELVCSTLGIKLKLGSLTKIKVLFTQDVFPEKVVAEHALTVPVTKGLNAKCKGFLPAHCIHQLIKSRVFTKHEIAVNAWIFQQLCSCSHPVHPLILQLIDTYVHAIINSVNISKTKQHRLNALKPFLEEDIIAVFTNPSQCFDEKTSQILFMLYALTYQNALLTNMKNLYSNPKAPREYNSNLYSKIPMKQLLLHTRGDEMNYGNLYPPLLKLVITYYPHLCLVEDWMDEEEIASSSMRSTKYDVINTSRVTANTPSFGFDGGMILQHPQKVIIKLTRLNLLQPNQLVDYADNIIELLPYLLNRDTPRKIQMLVTSLWLKVNTFIPETMWLKTVNILRASSEMLELNDLGKLSEYTNEDIQKDPLIVLRCNRKVYRCAPVFELLIRVLSGYLIASRALLNHHILANPLVAGSKTPQEMMVAQQDREELKIALVSAQESAAIQILLEACLPTTFERENFTYEVQSTLREIQCKVCCFIHQSFISAPNMAKLIHFQGYPPDLLSVTVPGVPSMHICLDFVPQLLNQPHLEKQLFAIQLASHLALQYPIPKSYSICKYIIDRLNNLLVTLPSAKRNQLFVPSLKCLVRIADAFPPSREDITQLVIKISRVSTSQLDKCSLVTPFQEAEMKNETETLADEAVDVAFDENNSESGECKPFNINNNTLSGDNPAYNRETFLKTYTTRELVKETEIMYQQITKLSLLDKLVLVDEKT